MAKKGIIVFAKDNKIALGLLGISITFAIVTFIVLYQKFKKMENATVPLKGRVTSKFGNRTAPTAGASTYHNGVDIAAALGTAIVSPLDGTVEKVFSNSSGGNQLIIKHTNGYKTGYAHLQSVTVAVGDKVKQGQKIAHVGNTGISTGAHLHFTVTNPLGVKVNPEDYFKF